VVLSAVLTVTALPLRAAAGPSAEPTAGPSQVSPTPPPVGASTGGVSAQRAGVGGDDIIPEVPEDGAGTIPEDGDGPVPVASDGEKLKAASIVGLDLSQPTGPIRDDRDFVFELWLRAKAGTEVKGSALLAMSDWDSESPTCVPCSLFIRRGIHEAVDRDARNEVRDRTAGEMAARRRTQAAELVQMPVAPRLVSKADRDFVIDLWTYVKESKPKFTATVAAAEAAFTATSTAVESFLAGGLGEAHALDQRRLIGEEHLENEVGKQEANRRFGRELAANAVGVDIETTDDAWMTTSDEIFLRDLAKRLVGDSFWSLTHAGLSAEVLNGDAASAKKMIDTGVYELVGKDRARRDKEVRDGYRAKVTKVRNSAIHQGLKNKARAGAAALATNSITSMRSYLDGVIPLPADSFEMALLQEQGPNTTAILTRSHFGRWYGGVDRQVWKSGAGNWDVAKSKPLNGDFDGDGKRDLAVLYGGGAAWRVQLVADLASASPAPKLVWDSPAVAGKGYDLRSAAGGDFNGDGRTDIAVYGKTAAGAPMLLVLTPGEGAKALTAKVHTVPESMIAGRLVAADVNGDKKDDVVTIIQDAAKGMQVWVAVSGATGPGTSAVKWTDKNFSLSTTTEPVAADFDGDGKPEVALFRQEKSGNNTGASLHMFADLNGTVQRTEPWRNEGGMSGTKLILNAVDVNGDDYVDLIMHYAEHHDKTWTYRLLSGPHGFTHIRSNRADTNKIAELRIAR
jgi:hypothetical protein